MRRIVVAAVLAAVCLSGVATPIALADWEAQPATGDLVLSASFSSMQVALNNKVYVNFQISNQTGAAQTGIHFNTTLLLAGLQANSTSYSVCGGTLTAIPTFIGFQNGSLAAGANCSIQASVTGAVAGRQTLSTIDVESDLVVGNSATAAVDVYGPLTITATLSRSTIYVGQSVDLTMTIANPNTVSVHGIDIGTTVPAGLSLSGSGAACHGNLSYAPSSMSLMGGWTSAGDTCSWSFAVGGMAAGAYDIQFSSAIDTSPQPAPVAHLTVLAPTPVPTGNGGAKATATPAVPAGVSAGASTGISASGSAAPAAGSTASAAEGPSSSASSGTGGPQASASGVPGAVQVSSTGSGPDALLLLVLFGAGLGMGLLIALVFWLGRRSAQRQLAPPADQPAEARAIAAGPQPVETRPVETLPAETLPPEAGPTDG